MSRACLLALCAALGACSSGPGNFDAGTAAVPTACGNDWQQWGLDSAHGGTSCASGQKPQRELTAVITYDPFTAAEQQDAQIDTGEADLLAHYQSPLIARDWLYMEVKTGWYTACDPDGGPNQPGCGPQSWDTETWNEEAWQWQNGALVGQWTHASSWKPEPSWLVDWEPVFQPVISGGFVYVPEAGGAVAKLAADSGTVVATISPFALSDGGTPIDTYVAGALAADGQGNVFYDVLQLSPPQGFLVRVGADDSVQTADFASLNPAAPAATDRCYETFGDEANPPPLPWPPPDVNGAPVLPPQGACGAQRPAINAAPAIAPDGTVYVVSRAANNPAYSYLVAVNPDLTPKWAASLRDRLNDGCGVTTPSDANTLSSKFVRATHCRTGARQGVDPETNLKPAGLVVDASSSSPVVLPDGSVLYGALSYYNADRGHLMRFDANGRFTGSYDFGWDDTPAVFASDGGYAIVTKDNHYFEPDGTPGPYFVTQLGPDLKPMWQFASTNTLSCERDGSGAVHCGDDGEHPTGFEWCVNAPAVDKHGVVFANSEDGYVYAIAQKGQLLSRYFLQLSIGAAYTPVALDGQGRIYALNGGTMRVIGQ